MRELQMKKQIYLSLVALRKKMVEQQLLANYINNLQFYFKVLHYVLSAILFSLSILF